MKNDILEAISVNSIFGVDEVRRVYEIFKSYDLLVSACEFAQKTGHANLETACILVKSTQHNAQVDVALCPVCDFEQQIDRVCEEHGIYKIIPRS